MNDALVFVLVEIDLVGPISQAWRGLLSRVKGKAVVVNRDGILEFSVLAAITVFSIMIGLSASITIHRR